MKPCSCYGRIIFKPGIFKKGLIPVHEINGQQFKELKIPLKADFPVLMLLGSVDGGLPESRYYSENFRRFYSIGLIAEQYFSSHAASIFAVMKISE